MTESVVTVLKHQTQSTVILCIVDPLSPNHPDWIGRTFTSDHEKYRTAVFVKCVIHKIPLLHTKRIQLIVTNIKILTFDAIKYPHISSMVGQ